MAGILGRYGQAREDSWFKTEQEADVQVHKLHMLGFLGTFVACICSLV